MNQKKREKKEKKRNKRVCKKTEASKNFLRKGKNFQHVMDVRAMSID